MSRARAWITLSTLAAAIGALSASCGSDEVTGMPPGGSLVGGGGGTGGTSARGGATGSGGASAPASNIGKACTSDAGCGATSGVSCVIDPQVPQGLCSSVCTTDSDCQPLSPGSVCSGTLCLEGCSVGPLTAGVTKCHGRADFSCGFFGTVPTATTCTVDADCGNSAVCGTTGTCTQVVTACEPTCASDDDCNGQFCNIGTGLCQPTAPAGAPVGTSCDPNAVPDPCAGFCISDGTSGICSGSCSLLVAAGCGWNGVGPADSGCFFIPRYLQSIGPSDAGYCTQFCDCDSQCRGSADSCLSFSALGLDNFAQAYGRAGFCSVANLTGPMPDVVIPTCPAGAGGAGGAGGAADAGGASGAPGSPGSAGASGADAGGAGGAG
jgi:hypothetical protein